MTWRRRVRNQADDSDVVADEAAFAHISIECKHANVLYLPTRWRQAQEQAGAAGVPALICRQKGARGETAMVRRARREPEDFSCPGAAHCDAQVGNSYAMDAGNAPRESDLFPGDYLMLTMTLSRLPSVPAVASKAAPLFASAHGALTFALNYSMQQYNRPLVNRVVSGELTPARLPLVEEGYRAWTGRDRRLA